MQEWDSKGLFLEEAEEQIAMINEKILELDKNKSDINLLNEIFRLVHTLKSSAALEKYDDMRDILHEMEDVLDKINNHAMELSKEVLGVFHVCIEKIQNIVVTGSGRRENVADVLDLIKKLKPSFKETNMSEQFKEEPEQREDLTTAISIVNKLSQEFLNGLPLFEIVITFEDGDLMKAARACLVYNNCLEIGEVFMTIPAVDIVSTNWMDNMDKFRMFVFSSRESGEIKQIINPGGVKLIDVSQIRKEDLEKVIKEKNNIKNDFEKDNGQARSTIRINIEQMDGYIAKLKELNMDQIRFSQITSSLKTAGINSDLIMSLEERVSYLEKHVEDLVRISLYFVSQPLDLIFRRLGRLVRNLSQEQGKEVVFKASGKHTMLDKDVVNYIVELLVHIIRNSVDHGIELPEERLAAGKSKVGKITLSIYIADDNLIIQIGDDGRGLNIPLIKEIALNRGIVTFKEAEEMSEEEFVNLIFKAGFSTKIDVSQISGRGVGMDVVSDVIKKLNGNISCQSEQNKGVMFILKIPLSVCQKKQREIINM